MYSFTDAIKAYYHTGKAAEEFMPLIQMMDKVFSSNHNVSIKEIKDGTDCLQDLLDASLDMVDISDDEKSGIKRREERKIKCLENSIITLLQTNNRLKVE